MSRKRNTKVGETPYRRALRDVITRMQAGEILDTAGKPTYTFTPAWLAAAIGRKVTADFRKAMAQFESENLIEPFDFYTEKGGLAKGYTVLVQTSFTDNRPEWYTHA